MLASSELGMPKERVFGIIACPRKGVRSVSTILYARLSGASRGQRGQARSGGTDAPREESAEDTKLKTYVDAVAALLPAEVLTLHAVVVSATTKTDGNTTTIEDVRTLSLAFWGLVLPSVLLYVSARHMANAWTKLDWYRMFIPPVAFFAWTLLQRATALDAFELVQLLDSGARTVIALFVAVLIGYIATRLTYEKPPRS